MPYILNEAEQEALRRVVAAPWISPEQQPGTGSRLNSMDETEAYRNGIVATMVPLKDLDVAARARVRDALAGLVRRALEQAWTDGKLMLGKGRSVEDIIISVNKTHTAVPLRPLHTW